MTDRPSVLIHSDAAERVRRIVEQDHPDLPVSVCTTYGGLAEAVAAAGAEVVYSIRFAGTPGFPARALTDSGTVRWVSVGGSGTDHLGRWDPDRLTVTNAAGVAADMMAEYVLGSVLHFTLDRPGFQRAQARRDWIAGRVAPLAGRTALVVGLGHTGRAVARRMQAMGVRVLGLRATPQPTDGVDEVHPVTALHDLLPRADVVVVCVPLLAGTRGLIGAEAVARLKPGAILVDVSRGGVVDGAALLGALDSGRLAGAALDVFETEPLPADHPFWGRDDVLITPHCSSVFDGWEDASARMFADNLGRYRRGEALTNVVDPDRGY